MRMSRTMVTLVVVLAVGATACGGSSTPKAASTSSSSAVSSQTSSSSSSASSNSSSSTGATATGGSGTSSFTLAGDVSGPFSAPALDLAQNEGKGAACGKQSDGTWDADFSNLSQSASVSAVRITDNNYSGPGSFTSDANPGDVTIGVSGQGKQWDTGVDKTWSLTINADEKSGKLHAELQVKPSTDKTTKVTIDGTFSC
jgi:hypothetical protein